MTLTVIVVLVLSHATAFGAGYGCRAWVAKKLAAAAATIAKV